MRWRLGRRLGASGRLRRRLGASFRRSELLFGVLHRLVLNGHVGQGGRGFPEAHEPLPARIAPAPAYAPVTPSAAAAPGRRASKRISAAVPVPEASAARRPPPPTMATPGPASLALAVSSRHATSTCSRATTTASCSTPGADIRPWLPVALTRKHRVTLPGRRRRRAARLPPVRGRAAPRPTATSASGEYFVVARRENSEAPRARPRAAFP
jgi:hypothetical protein